MTALQIWKKFFSVKTLLSFGFAFFIFYLFLSNVDIKDVLLILSKVNIKLLISAFAFYYVLILITALRWKIILKNTGINCRIVPVTEIVFLGQFVNTLMPARIGDFYRAHLAKKEYNISRSAVFGTLFIEKVLDFSSLILLLFASAFIIFEGKVPNAVLNVIILGSIFIFSALMLFLIVKSLRKKIVKLIPKKIVYMIKNFEKSASSSINLKSLPLILLLTLGSWTAASAVFYFVLLSLQVSFGFFQVLFVVLLANLLIALPLTPSGIGIVEAGVAGILILLNIEKNVAVSIALLNGIVNYWNQLIVGFFAYIFSKRS